MSGLIGDKEKAKFIFFAVDEEAELPKKSEMLMHFPDCSYNVYKSWGHFRETFSDLEAMLHIKHHGLEAGKFWNPPRYISHAYRIDTQSEPDSFFVTKYSTALVGFYELSQPALIELNGLLGNWNAQNEIMENMEKITKNFEVGKKAASLINIIDESMTHPDEDAIEKLFGHYGIKAAEQIIDRITNWQSKIKWQ